MTVYIVMGVCGCGKTTVGRLLAERLGVPFHDADDFHPRANVERMRRGEALTDDDRRPWLEELATAIAAWNRAGGAVLACSALKRSYRAMLGAHDNKVSYVYLKGSADIIRQRMAGRTDHYMNPALIESQFATLEEPKDAIVEDVRRSPAEIADSVLARIAGANAS